MADTKTTALTRTEPKLGDLLYGVSDPNGTPLSVMHTELDGSQSAPVEGSDTTPFAQRILSSNGSVSVTELAGGEAVDLKIRPEKIWLPAAGINNGTAGLIWDLGTSGQATLGQDATINAGYLVFPNTGITNAKLWYFLPSDWTDVGGIDIDIVWNTAATSGDVKWFGALHYEPVDGTSYPGGSYNSATTAVQTAPGTTTFIQTASLTGLDLSGFVSGQMALMPINIKRDSADGSDTIAAAVNFWGAMLTFRRKI